jgi:hypothetical protein
VSAAGRSKSKAYACVILTMHSPSHAKADNARAREMRAVVNFIMKNWESKRKQRDSQTYLIAALDARTEPSKVDPRQANSESNHAGNANECGMKKGTRS